MKIANINNEKIEFDKTSVGMLTDEKYKNWEHLGYGTIDSINGKDFSFNKCQWHFWRVK